jgi:hypothetical protein
VQVRTFPLSRLVVRVATSLMVGVAATIGFAAAASALPAQARLTSVPRCPTRSLVIWIGRSGVATGTVVEEFGFTNDSAKACSLEGYPRVQMLAKSGKNQQTVDHRESPEILPVNFDIKEKVVVLTPGKTAHFWIAFHDETGYGPSTCPTSDALRFSPPHDTATITLRGRHGQIAAYYGSVQHLVCGVIQVTPVTAELQFG